MKIVAVQYVGAAGPYVIMDLCDAFKDLGHEPVIVHATDIVEMKGKLGDERAYQEIAKIIGDDLKPAFVFGYGAVPVMHFKMMDGTFLNLFESINIPYVSIVYDNPLDDYMFNSFMAAYNSNIHHIFTWERCYAEQLKLMGFHHSHYMPIGVNTKRYFKIPEAAREGSSFAHDVAFVGAYSQKREIVMRRLLKHNPAIYGYMWEQNAGKDLVEKFLGKADNVTDLPQIFNYSKINLNITMFQGVTSLNMRVYEVLACEGFLITDYKEDLEQLFDIEKEIVCYRSVDELEDLVDYYLRHEDERKEKARLGRKRVLREHNYKKRAEYILNKLEEGGVPVH